MSAKNYKEVKNSTSSAQGRKGGEKRGGNAWSGTKYPPLKHLTKKRKWGRKRKYVPAET